MKKLILSLFAASFCFGTNAQTLVYHGTFNGNANDLSGNGYHGTVFGSPVYVAGFTGTPSTAIFLDGIDDRIQLPTNAAFNLESWTLQAMVRPASLTNAVCQASSIIWHGTSWSAQHYRLAICDNWYETGNVCAQNTNQDVFDAQGPGTSATPDFQSWWYPANGFVTPNTWYCVTAQLTPAATGATLNLYIDGVLIESAPWTGGLYNYTGNQATHIGWSPSPGFPYWFNGTIDQVSIWNGALSANDIGKFCDATRINFWKQSSPEEEETIEQVNSLAIADEKIEITPVPATDKITVTVPEQWKGGKMVIMNGVGQILMEQTIEGTLHNINIKELPTGIYMLKTTKGNESKVEKFVKD